MLLESLGEQARFKQVKFRRALPDWIKKYVHNLRYYPHKPSSLLIINVFAIYDLKLPALGNIKVSLLDSEGKEVLTTESIAIYPVMAKQTFHSS